MVRSAGNVSERRQGGDGQHQQGDQLHHSMTGGCRCEVVVAEKLVQRRIVFIGMATALVGVSSSAFTF